MVGILAAAAFALAPAVSAPATSASSHLRLCAALSGGGARGLAHVGVLQALEAEDIRIDCVAGTSMGALVGSLYAAGYSPAEMETVVGSLEWQDVFSSRPERPLVPLAQRIDDNGAVFSIAVRGARARLPAARDSDYRTNRLLFRLLAEPGFVAGGDFDRLPRPFRAVATDLENGQQVVLASGSLARAVRASLSTPVKLVPVRVDGRVLVDGGLVDNLPTSVARALGADAVLAVDTRSAALSPKPTDTFVDTTAVLVDMLMRDRNQRTAAPADVLIDLRPGLTGLNEAQYPRFAEAIAIGRRLGSESARAVASRLGDAHVEASGNGSSGEAGARHPESPRLEGTPVREILVKGASRVRESVVRRAFALEAAQPFVMEHALRGMDSVYATRLFESVWLDATPASEGGATVTVEVREAPRLRLELGGGFDEADEARGFLRIRNRNLLGRGERSDTTLLASDAEVGVRTALTAERPLGLPFGVFTRAHLVHEKPRVFGMQEPLGRAEFRRQGLALGVLHRLGTTGLVRFGLARDTVRTRAKADVPFAAAKDELASAFGEAAWDRLDDRALPGHGASATLFASRGFTGLSGTRTYWRALANVRAAATLHRRLFLRGELLGALSGRDLPVYEQVRLGGPLLPGLHRDELWGAQALAGSVTVGTRVFRELRLLGRAGAGDVFSSRSEVRLGGLRRGLGLGLEMPTRFGPLTLDWGRGGGHSRLYVSLGFPWERAPVR